MEGSVRRRGKKWYYRFDAADKNGKRFQVERVGGNTKKEASIALEQALAKYHSAGIFKDEENISVNDYMLFWLENYVEKNLSTNSYINYKNIISKYVLPKLGIYHLNKLTPAVIQKFINEVAESTEYKHDHTPLSKHSVEIILMVVKESLRHAVHPWQLIDHSPADYVTMPKYRSNTDQKDLKIITPKQFKMITTILDEYQMIPFYIAYYTGMRRGEVCGLTWANINLNRQIITVNQQMKQYAKNDIRIGTLKTAASYRTITIGKTLTNILKHQQLRQKELQMKYGSYYYKSDFVCTKKSGKPITPMSIKYMSDRIHAKLGFPFNFHSLRHTHATMLLEAGASPKEVQVRLGHSRISTTLDTYVHLSNSKKRQTADLFDQVSG